MARAARAAPCRLPRAAGRAIMTMMRCGHVILVGLLAAVAAPAQAVIHGRCVAGESGEPLAHATAELARETWFPVVTTFAVDPWREPLRAACDRAGSFTLAVPVDRAGERSLILRLRAPGRGTRTVRYAEGLPASEEVGSVPLWRGATIAGRLLDAHSQPIAGVAVVLRGAPLPWRGGVGLHEDLEARTDADGAWSIAEPVAAGRYALSLRPACELRAGGWVDVPPEGGVVSSVLTAPRPARIAGRVLDAAGRPAADVAVVAEGQDGRYVSERTGAAGHFEILASDPGPITGWQCRGHGVAPLVRVPAPATWGQSDVALRVPDEVAVTVAVVAGEPPVPVMEFAVALVPVGVPSARWEQAGAHPGGLVSVRSRHRGLHRVLVLPRDQSLGWSADATVELPAKGTEPLRVRLRPRRQIRARVVDPEGRPLPGVCVEALAALRDAPPADRVGADLDRRASWLVDTLPAVLTVDTARSDAAGCATLSVLDADGQFVRASAPGWLPAVVPAAAPRVVLARSAGLRGRVVPAAAVPLGHGLVLRRVGGQSLARHAWCEPVAGSGQFAFFDLEPGTWEIRLCAGELGLEHLVQPMPLATVTLAAGQTVDLELDARAYLPSRLDLEVRQDGEPPRGCGLRLLLPHARGPAPLVWDCTGPRESVFFWQLDAQGRFACEALAPGEYELSLWPAAPTGTSTPLRQTTFTVAPGASRTGVLDIR